MARERKGTLVRRSKGWAAVVTVTEHGRTRKRWFPLGTTDERAAEARLKKLVAAAAAGTLPARAVRVRRAQVVARLYGVKITSRETARLSFVFSSQYVLELLERGWLAERIIDRANQIRSLDRRTSLAQGAQKGRGAAWSVSKETASATSATG